MGETASLVVTPPRAERRLGVKEWLCAVAIGQTRLRLLIVADRREHKSQMNWADLRKSLKRTA
jgi:hypothetical protein